ncbi:MAG: hypothetical protein AAF368_18015, partial [Planctomycetota bacterium]
GEFKETAKLWDEAATRLRSPARQGELAAVYSDLARELEHGEDGGIQRDRKAALSQAYDLYSRILDLAAPETVKQAALFSMAENLFTRGLHQEAAAHYARYLKAEEKTAGDAPLLQREVRSEGRLTRARYKRGRSLAFSRKQSQGRRELEDLNADLEVLITEVAQRANSEKDVAPFASVAEATEAWTQLRERRRETLHALPSTYRTGIESEDMLAVASWRSYLEFTAALQDPLETARARLSLGKRLKQAGRPEEAAAEWRELIAVLDKDRGQKDQDKVRAQTLFQLGLLVRSQENYPEARSLFERYTREHPSGENWSQAQQLLRECEAEQAELLASREDHAAARQAWSTFLQAHPLDPRAPDILLAIGALHDTE